MESSPYSRATCREAIIALTTRAGWKPKSWMPAGKCPISRTHSSSRDARVLSVVEEVLTAGVVGGMAEEAADDGRCRLCAAGPGVAAEEEEVVVGVAREARDRSVPSSRSTVRSRLAMMRD